MYHPHTAASAACRRFNNHRESDFPRDTEYFIRIVGQGAIGARHGWHTGASHLLFRGNLIAHQANRFCRWADKLKPAIFYLFGKVRVF